MISVILPVYNGAETLGRAVESVRAQTCSEWELLIADDGSTDGSASIAHDLSVQDSRIRVLELLAHTAGGGGVSHARNRALDAAQGEHIAFLDSDDELEPTHLQTLLEAIAGCDLAVGGYHLESDLTHELLQIERDNPYIDFRFMHIAPANAIYKGDAEVARGIANLLETDTLYPVWNKLYRRALLEKHQIRFDQTLASWGEDELFNAAYLRHCDSMACTDARTVCYMTQRLDALSYRYDDTRISTEQRMHCILTELFDGKRGLTDPVRMLLGEVYIGKLVLSLENDLRQDFIISVNELQERWERVMCDSAVQSALAVTGLRMQFITYLNEQLLTPLFLSAMLRPYALVSRHTRPGAYLRDWLLAVNYACEADENFEALHERALEAGAPWRLDTMGGGL